MSDKPSGGPPVLILSKRPPIFISRDYGLILDAYVTPEYRRQGVGQLLLGASLEWFKRKKIKRVDLYVLTANKIGTKFWLRSGFKEHSKRMYMELK